MAIGHEFSSSMKLAILLLMTALFLYGNVDTSFLILRRNVSALFTFRCCLREKCNHFLTLPSMSSVSRTLWRKKQNRTLSMVYRRGGIVVECHSRPQNFEGRCIDFSHICYEVRYLTPSMQLNLISWTTKKL